MERLIDIKKLYTYIHTHIYILDGDRRVPAGSVRPKRGGVPREWELPRRPSGPQS